MVSASRQMADVLGFIQMLLNKCFHISARGNSLSPPLPDTVYTVSFYSNRELTARHKIREEICKVKSDSLSAFLFLDTLFGRK